MNQIKQIKILTIFAALAISGCSIKHIDSKNAIEAPNLCVTYTVGKIRDSLEANITSEQGVALMPNAVKVIIYEGSLNAGFGILQFMDPNFNLKTMPGQKLKLKFADGNESEIVYIFNNNYPYSFRVNDRVLIERNATDILSIQAANQ